MTAGHEHLDDDVPVGAVGRFLGFGIATPKMQDGEEVLWSVRANMVQHRVRAVGGRLYLTDRRLVFGRSRIESALGGKEWSASLSDLISASSGGRRSIRIEGQDGRVEKFILGSPDPAAEVVDRAIRSRATD
jgi:hypothetical protein